LAGEWAGEIKGEGRGERMDERSVAEDRSFSHRVDGSSKTASDHGWNSDQTFDWISPEPNTREVTSTQPTQPAGPISGLSHVQLTVSDASESANWYRTALGLDPYAEDLDIGYVALRHPQAKFVMVLTERASTEEPPAGGSEHLDHIAFAVPDGASLESWAKHLNEVGIDHDGIVLENGHPSLQLRDPDHIAIELVAP
jgi:catechol 2,3-dioxygenase-like lactoylglutathione lyase family enzyme